MMEDPAKIFVWQGWQVHEARGGLIIHPAVASFSKCQNARARRLVGGNYACVMGTVSFGTLSSSEARARIELTLKIAFSGCVIVKKLPA